MLSTPAVHGSVPLASHRRVMGWSQLDLAIRAGVSVRTVTAIEARRQRPSRLTADSIALVLGVTPADVAELRDA